MVGLFCLFALGPCSKAVFNPYGRLHFSVAQASLPAAFSDPIARGGQTVIAPSALTRGVPFIGRLAQSYGLSPASRELQSQQFLSHAPVC